MRRFPRNSRGDADGTNDIHNLQGRLGISDEGAVLGTFVPNFFFRSEGDIGILDIELPGVRMKDIDIEIDGIVLAITAKRSASKTTVQTSPQHTSHNSSLISGGNKFPLEGRSHYPSCSTDDSGKTNKTAMLHTRRVAPPQNNPSSASGDKSYENSPSRTDQPSQVFIIYKSVFALDGRWNPEKIKALRCEDGILTLYLGKREKRALRKIDIR